MNWSYFYIILFVSDFCCMAWHCKCMFMYVFCLSLLDFFLLTIQSIFAIISKMATLCWKVWKTKMYLILICLLEKIHDILLIKYSGKKLPAIFLGTLGDFFIRIWYTPCLMMMTIISELFSWLFFFIISEKYCVIITDKSLKFILNMSCPRGWSLSAQCVPN